MTALFSFDRRPRLWEVRRPPSDCEASDALAAADEAFSGGHAVPGQLSAGPGGPASGSSSDAGSISGEGEEEDENIEGSRMEVEQAEGAAEVEVEQMDSEVGLPGTTRGRRVGRAPQSALDPQAARPQAARPRTARPQARAQTAGAHGAAAELCPAVPRQSDKERWRQPFGQWPGLRA